MEYFKDEIIESIKEYEDSKYYYFSIKTNKQTMNFGISTFQVCCENYGINILYDNKKIDLNAELCKELENKFMDKKILSVKWNEGKYGEDCIININIDNEFISVELFNDHNGYYPHTYKVNWCDYTDEDEI